MSETFIEIDSLKTPRTRIKSLLRRLKNIVMVSFKDGYLMEIKLEQKSSIINFRALTLSRQVKKFPVHVVISVLGIFNEVFRSGEPVFIQ